jgi:hypothetical protein
MASPQFILPVKSRDVTYGISSDESGQLGDGRLLISLVPIAVKFEKVKPVGSVVINGGAAYTTTRAVTLTLSVTDAGGPVTQMRISNDGVFDTETWEKCITTRNWMLTLGEGLRTVYVKFLDTSGNESDVAVATITLTMPSTLTSKERFFFRVFFGHSKENFLERQREKFFLKGIEE